MNLFTPIEANTGYGITGYNIWKHLYKIDKNICLFIIGSGEIEPTWQKTEIIKSINKKNTYDQNAPCLKIWHGNDFFLKPAGQGLYAGLSFFEIDKLTEQETVSYSLLDKIICPSTWAKNILLNHNINKEITVCPMGVDRTTFNDVVPSDKLEDKYIFINIGKWEVRKGHDILVDIFNKAFTTNDNVELWMVNYNGFIGQEGNNQWINLYKNSKLGEKIKIYPRLPTQDILSKVMSYADCGIFPSRGEGWNNEAIELLSMNKPLIITNYSAHTEYCNSQNSYLININNTTEAIDGVWFKGEGSWAFIGPDQVDQTIEYMKYVYRNNIRTNPNGVKTAETYSWTNTAQNLYSCLYDK